MQRHNFRFGMTTAVLLAASVALGGCGGTKLWGKEDQAAAVREVPKETLREHAARAAEPVWQIDGQGSWMGRVAGVLISGEEDADTATAAFDLSGQEGKSVDMALNYLESLEENNEGIDELAARVTSDAQRKNADINSFLQSALVELNARLDQRDKAVFSSDKDKPSLKRVLSDADNDRRSVAQVEKALEQQYDVFLAARDIMSNQRSGVDLTTLNIMLGELELKKENLTDLVRAFRFEKDA